MGRRITVELTEKQAQALIAAANHQHQYGNLTPSQRAVLRSAQGEVHDALPIRIEELSVAVPVSEEEKRHLVDAAASAMGKLLLRVANGQVTPDDAAAILLDWPNLGEEATDGQR